MRQGLEPRGSPRRCAARTQVAATPRASRRRRTPERSGRSPGVWPQPLGSKGRVDRGSSLEAALELPGSGFEPHKTPLSVGGTVYEGIAAACRSHDVRPQDYNSRRKRGWSPEQAIGLSEHPRGRKGCAGIIYKVTHLATGRAYVGLTQATVAKRWEQHIAAAMRDKAPAPGSLQDAIRILGASEFAVLELARATTQGELAKLERAFIKSLSTLAPAGFNLNAGGAGIHALGKPVTVGGTKYPSVAEACRRLDLDASTVRARLDSGSSVEEAFALPVRPRSKPLAFRGQHYETEKALAETFGVKYSVFRARRFKGRSLEQALELEPLPPKSTSVTVNGRVFENLKLAAEQVGIPYNTVIMRRAKGYSLQQAFSTHHLAGQGESFKQVA